MKFLAFIILLIPSKFHAQTSVEVLKNKTWVLHYINDLNENKSIIMKGRYTLYLTDSIFEGEGCNMFSAPYSIEEDKIIIPWLKMTDRGCFKEEGLVESYILKYFYKLKYLHFKDSLYLINDQKQKTIFTYYGKK